MERDSDASAAPVRLAARAETLGLAPPPLHLALRVETAEDEWRIEIDARCLHPLEKLASWIEALRPKRVELRADHTLLVEVADATAPWAQLLWRLGRVRMEIDVDGAVVIEVTAAKERIAALARQLGANATRRAPASREIRLLTDAQDGALREAVASGYYDVPRAINLQHLATRLGVTSASLSERLRRAEGRLIKRYVRGELVLSAAEPDKETAPTHPRGGTR